MLSVVSRSSLRGGPSIAQQRADALLALLTNGGATVLTEVVLPVRGDGRRRHPTVRQKRVVRERDRRCIDCGSTDLPQYDHQPNYEQTHHTIIEELWIRCAVCHHKRHGKTGGREEGGPVTT